MEKKRDIVYYKKYFLAFFDKQSEKVKKKIEYVLFLITVAERIPAKFLKHIEGTQGLYEIRVEYGGNIYRKFCCFDQDSIAVLFNGFHKESQKTPQEEIERALKLKEEYFATRGR